MSFFPVLVIPILISLTHLHAFIIVRHWNIPTTTALRHDCSYAVSTFSLRSVGTLYTVAIFGYNMEQVMDGPTCARSAGWGKS